MKTKKKALFVYLGITLITAIFILLSRDSSYIKDIIIGGVCISVLAGFIVLAGSTGIEYFIQRNETIQSFLNYCLVFTNHVDQAITLTNGHIGIKDCYFLWEEVNLYYSNQVVPAYKSIYLFRRSQKYIYLRELYLEISQFHVSDVELILSRFDDIFKKYHINNNDQSIENESSFYHLDSLLEPTARDLGKIKSRLNIISVGE